MTTMPIPYTPLYIGLADTVARLLGSVADSQPDDITDRAGQLEDTAGDLRTLAIDSQQALQSGYGMDTWTGSAADSGRGLIEDLLQLLGQRADSAEQEATSLRQIADLLQTAQDHYTQQASSAEQMISQLMANPITRELAPLVALLLAARLEDALDQLQQALASVGTTSLMPLSDDADLVAGPTYEIDDGTGVSPVNILQS